MTSAETVAELQGSGGLSADAATLAEYGRDVSFVNAVQPAYVISPSDGQQVQKLVRLANETKTPLVPVSSGPPHFRGDTVPSIGGAIVVDLSDMKRIVFVDRPRRVAMVEPGVTFGELIPAATREGIRLNLPLLPRSTKSVVGSLLEREPVVMPKYQWDISDPLACLGVVFGNGEEFRTGQAAGPGTLEEQWAVGGVQKAPYGPHIAAWHRLIQGAQGTMGIVTWASLRCELLPQLEEPFVVGSSQVDAVLELAAWLIRLRAVNECFILSAASLATIFSDEWSAEYDDVRDRLPEWILFYTVAGYDYFPEERVSSYIKEITALTQRLGLQPKRAVGALSADEILEVVQQPSRDPYWKLRPKGACEDVFFLTTDDKVPALAADVAEFPHDLPLLSRERVAARPLVRLQRLAARAALDRVSGRQEPLHEEGRAVLLGEGPLALTAAVPGIRREDVAVDDLALLHHVRSAPEGRPAPVSPGSLRSACWRPRTSRVGLSARIS